MYSQPPGLEVGNAGFLKWRAPKYTVTNFEEVEAISGEVSRVMRNLTVTVLPQMHKYV